MANMFDVVRAERIRDYFVNQHLTMREIAALEGVSHPMVQRTLRRIGVSASEGTHVHLVCPVCGKAFERLRYVVRQTRTPTCSRQCYFARRKNPATVLWRHGQRKARQVVRNAGFALAKSHVVHHVDGNNRNNRRRNLWVFASQSDHLKFHHGSRVEPIWRGDGELCTVGNP